MVFTFLLTYFIITNTTTSTTIFIYKNSTEEYIWVCVLELYNCTPPPPTHTLSARYSDFIDDSPNVINEQN